MMLYQQRGLPQSSGSLPELTFSGEVLIPRDLGRAVVESVESRMGCPLIHRLANSLPQNGRRLTRNSRVHLTNPMLNVLKTACHKKNKLLKWVFTPKHAY